MPPVGWLHRHLRVSSAFIPRPSPQGLMLSKLCAGKLRLSNPPTDPPPSLFGVLTERLQDAHSSAFGRLPEPPGSTEHLRVFIDRPCGVHRRIILCGSGLSRPKRTTCDELDDFGCPSARVFATEPLRMLTEPPGSTGPSYGRPKRSQPSILAVPRR